MGLKQRKIGWWRALHRFLFPAVPESIVGAMQRAQFESVRSQVPMLLAVAALNTCILMAVCAHEGMDFTNYGWLSLLIVYCVFRIGFWIRRSKTPYDPADIPRLLKMTIVAARAMISVLGMVSALTFAAGTFDSLLLVPMSLGFGTVSIAHCLYTLRSAAIGTLIMGLLPSSIAMLLIGPFEAQMLGLAMLSVGVLMVRFVAAQYNQLVASLLLADENRRLALTDPLTGLANRRAAMAALDEAVDEATTFGIALIDLDGFKQINDQFGHPVGDGLLCAIAERLRGAARKGDVVGRLGGDEFIVLFRNVTSETDCAARSNAYLAALAPPLILAGVRMPFGASLGFAVHGVDGAEVEALLHSADQALYAAKRIPAATQAGQARSVRLAA
ncbi:MAG: diguanylate cyclase [Novosphingobium sp.]|jgi:diguanylate cyclase (GGDEF)-like protein|nr:diguanylate cyclase [Novosphingobium sp.]